MEYALVVVLPLETKLFTYIDLFDDIANGEKIKSFAVDKPSGKGLERYLKELAETEERSFANRTYIVLDRYTREIAGFFSLRTGLFTVQSPYEERFETIPAVELSNFAVNSAYRKQHPEVRHIGETMLNSFIVPLVRYTRKILGIQALYIYALPEDELIAHYTKLGFHRLPPEMESFVHEHVKPLYDTGCIFMYQIL